MYLNRQTFRPARGDAAIPPDAKFLAHYDQRLLRGVVVLDVTLLVKSAGDWKGRLYREFRREELKPVKTKLIPYSVWANRGKSEMSVWLPVAHSPATPAGHERKPFSTEIGRTQRR
jgi:DUF1680 family protein